jgi:endogenous inhibitor of DNA gyrase (YacG/DUF329 family)
MKCPICRKPVDLTNPFVPFCSERCKLIDLGNWASEKYVISTPLKPGEEPEEAGDDESK